MLSRNCCDFLSSISLEYLRYSNLK